jgi:hypothetical protein
MNRKFLVAWFVAFIAWMCGDFAVHGVWLSSQYLAIPTLYRPEADQMQYMPWMIGAHVITAGALAWIYARGVSVAPWMGQGVRYGLGIAALTSPAYLIYYSVQPLPMSLVTNQVIGNAVVMIVVGIATAFVYKDTAKA